MIWEGVFQHLLEWPTSRIEAFEMYWRNYLMQNGGHESMFYHDSPVSYVVPFFISDAKRAEMRSAGASRQLYELTDSLALLVEQHLIVRPVDWTKLRNSIEDVLGEELPNRKQTKAIWARFEESE